MALNRLHLFLILIAIGMVAPLHAQKQGQQLIDSLLQQLPKTKEDTNKVNILNEVSYNFFFVNSVDGIKYGRQSLALAKQLRWQKGIATAYKNIGNGYMSLSDYDSALAQYFQALDLFAEINNRSGEARVLNNIASIYDDKGDYNKALTYAFRALKINEETGDKNGQSKIYTTIGLLYETPKKYTEALHYDSLALALSLELNDKQSAAINMGNMGNVYLYQEKYPLALKFDLSALKVYEDLQDSSAIANKLSNISDLYAKMRDFSKAMEYGFNALSIYQRAGDKQAIGIVLANIGTRYLAITTDTTGKIKYGKLIPANKNVCLKQAIIYSEQAAQIFKSIGSNNELQATYSDLAEEYFLSGDFSKGRKNYRLFSDLIDTIFTASNAVKLANLEKEKEKQDKEKQEQLNKLDATNARNQRIFFSIGTVMLLVIIGLVIRQRRRSEILLTNVLPHTIAERLKKKEHPIADHFNNASIMFIDMAGFTKFSDRKDPKVVVNVLSDVFTKFDTLAEKHGLEKIKTIGDCYMAASGLPERRPDHAAAAAAMAIDVKNAMHGYTAPDGTPISFRIGLHCGPVVAGVIGKKKFIYDLWGDAVNTASRMESTGLPGEIHCSDAFKKALPKNYLFTNRGLMEIKGKGLMETWLIKGTATQ